LNQFCEQRLLLW